MQPNSNVVQSSIEAVEAEMRRIGAWQDQPLADAQYDFHAAFASDTMAFEQWLQFVFIPRVRSIIVDGGEFPSRSEVSAQAFREWVAWGNRQDVESLIERLREFDALFG
jgi:uncharacterized protein YqcC (DUF446 family)